MTMSITSATTGGEAPRSGGGAAAGEFSMSGYRGARRPLLLFASSPSDPDFRACHQPVGDFPEVAVGLKGITTRIFTAFGAGLAPIL